MDTAEEHRDLSLMATSTGVCLTQAGGVMAVSAVPQQSLGRFTGDCLNSRDVERCSVHTTEAEPQVCSDLLVGLGFIVDSKKACYCNGLGQISILHLC